jgi:Uma2 family endonuclease
VPGSPDLAVEVISPSNLAQDTLKKVRQYLAGGSQAVWLVYPNLRLIEIHDPTGIQVIAEPETLVEERLFPNLSFRAPINNLFNKDPAA